jgi:predicted lipid-binding transport protein (Tim44 family)
MRTPTGKFLRAGLMAVLGLALVAGCTDDPKPGTVGTPTPTPVSSSASPTPSTPEAQIEAAVRAYYAELTKAAQTNDTSRLKKLTSRACPCYRPVTVIEAGAKRGETTPEASWSIESVRVHDLEGRSAVAEVKYGVTAYDVIDKDGDVVGSVPARQNHYDLSMVQNRDGHWIIANVFDLAGWP